MSSRVIWHIYSHSDECGEIEGMFTEEGELLGMWSSNDASWMNEYFSRFMKKLGIIVRDNWRDPLYADLKKKLEEKAQEYYS